MFLSKSKFRSISLTVFFLLWTCVLNVDTVSTQLGEVVASFPSPGDRPTGLAWDGQYLWNADIGTNTLYQIDPTNGAVVYSVPGPSGATVNGLAWDGNFLWCSDNGNDCLCKIDVGDSSLVHVIFLDTETPRGMTFEDNFIWYQDSGEKRIYKLNPSADTIVDTFVSPSGYNRGLTWDGKYLWSTDRDKNEIYMIDPLRGSVFLILSAPGTYSYGLTWDGAFLWNADYDTDRIYKIQGRGTEKYSIQNPFDVRIRYSVKVKNVGSSTMNLETFLAVPFESLHQSLNKPVEFEPTPDEFFTDRWGQEIAHFEETLIPDQENLYQWETEATTYDLRYYLFPDSVGGHDEIPQEIIDDYTEDGDKYKITDPVIINAVNEALNGESDYYWMIRNLHDYVISHIYYKMDGTWDDAPTVLSQGHGSCSEYSYLFIALCRAAGIPARYEAGGHLRGDLPYADSDGHRWQQVYFPNYGWVPIDCTWDDKEYPANQARYFGALSTEVFVTTLGGGGDYGLWWTYNCANVSTGGIREREKVMEWLQPTLPTLSNLNVVSCTAPQSASPGEVIGDRIEVYIQNDGTSHTDSFSVGFYISTDTIIATDDNLLIDGREYLSSVAAGDTVEVLLSAGASVPENLQPGNYYLGVLVDESNTVQETNEEDNYFVQPLSLLGWVCGDVNDDSMCNSTDALVILSYDVGLDIPQDFVDKIDAKCGDINADSLTNSTDALVLLSYDVGIPVPFCVCTCACPCPGTPTLKVATVSGVKVRTRTSHRNIVKGEKITFPVEIDVTETSELLGSFTATLHWDPQVLCLVAYDGGETAGFENPVVKMDDVALGSLSFAVAHPEGAEEVVNVLSVTFEVVGSEGTLGHIGLSFSAMTSAVSFKNLLSRGSATEIEESFTIGSEIPTIYSLDQNYPNPFNLVTSIQYSVVSDQSSPHATLKIYNLLGQEVRTLVDETKETGYYKVTWDGRDAVGRDVGSGVYFYRLKAGEIILSRKLVLVK